MRPQNFGAGKGSAAFLAASAKAAADFFLNAHCLKLDRAGPKPQARFTSQHYSESAQSTLAKSILRERLRLAAGLTGDWRAEIERPTRIQLAIG